MKNLWNKIADFLFRFFNPKAALLADLAAEKAALEAKITAAEAAIAEKEEAEEAERLRILEIVTPYVAETKQHGRDALLTLANVAGVNVSQLLTAAENAAEAEKNKVQELDQQIVDLSAQRNFAQIKADRLQDSVSFFTE